MPRINRVEKARKAQGNCGKCGVEIGVGDSYLWIQFRHGGRIIRCLKHECRFRDSNLTQSKMSDAYRAQEDAEDAANKWDGEKLEDLQTIAEECASEIRDVAEEYRESADNIRATFEESPIADDCEEKADGLEEWAGEIEDSLQSFDEFDSDVELSRKEWADEVRSTFLDALGNVPSV